MSKYRKQHLVSQLVLRRFTQAGQIIRVDLQTGQRELRNPASCMYKRGYISANPKEAEELWGTVERRLPPALAALDAGTLFQNQNDVNAIKDCIALHFARSFGLLWTRRTALDRAEAKVRAKILEEDRQFLERQFYLRHHFYPAGSEGLQLAADEFIAEAERLIDNPETFSKTVRETFEVVLARFGASELEISSPEHGAGEFLIGDAPALTLRRGSLGGGPHGGVPIFEADTVIMPLGPRHLASLSITERVHDLTQDQMTTVNRSQVINAFNEVCFRSGDLLPLVLAERPPASLAGGAGPQKPLESVPSRFN
ncbi:MAG: DUF4238 domain-containing protein [Candidatus Dormibacteraeota bacterium]|nr:DUF4238 domain-containing protein [Candidatus Dormibacteraeota bacterium]